MWTSLQTLGLLIAAILSASGETGKISLTSASRLNRFRIFIVGGERFAVNVFFIAIENARTSYFLDKLIYSTVQETRDTPTDIPWDIATIFVSLHLCQ